MADLRNSASRIDSIEKPTAMLSNNAIVSKTSERSSGPAAELQKQEKARLHTRPMSGLMVTDSETQHKSGCHDSTQTEHSPEH